MSVSPASPRFNRICNRDPRIMAVTRALHERTSTYWGYGSGEVGDEHPSFWSYFTNTGAFITATATADTWQEIINTTAPGFLVNIVSPVYANGTTTTWRITVDGTEYTFTTITSLTCRSILGPVDVSDIVVASTQSMREVFSAFNVNTGDQGVLIGNGDNNAVALWGLNKARANPFALVRYNASLKVEVKNSAGFSTALANGRNCGVTLALDR